MSRGWFRFHSFQPWFFSKTDRCFFRVLGGFVERRMPGKNGEGTPRICTGVEEDPTPKNEGELSFYVGKAMVKTGGRGACEMED